MDDSDSRKSAGTHSGEFKRLQEDLMWELENRVVQVADFCRRNEIDADLFRKLLPPVMVAGTTTEGSWQWLGHDRTWIVGTVFHEAREQDIKKLLVHEKRSVNWVRVLMCERVSENMHNHSLPSWADFLRQASRDIYSTRR